jgi:dTDP-4-amino-4,6-dideoxygalactose transaminase
MRDKETKMDPRLPLCDPGAENRSIRKELLDAIGRVVDGGLYILGPEVRAFEHALARSTDTAGAVGVASGTDALVIALQAAGVTAGDEVIAPSHTAGPTVAAIRMIGAVPVLVDVEADTFCLDPAQAEAAVGPRSKALIAVHLYGHPARMDELNAVAARHDLLVIEDCAQAQGARLGGRFVGGIGHLGCFSFYPTKNLGALGDGGAVTANDANLLARARSLRTYGWQAPQFATLPFGRCSRLDELQAAILKVKIGRVEAMNSRRRRIAALYREGLSDLALQLPTERANCRHVYHLFVVRSERRNALEAWLAHAGIVTGRHYPYPAHAQPGLADGARIVGSLSITEQLSGEILSLPMFSAMTDGQVARTIDAIREFHYHG